MAKKRRPRGRGQCNPCECGDHFWAPTSRGHVTYVSPGDEHHLRTTNWCALSSGYVFSQRHGRSIYLHKEILHPGAGLEVDHRDHNKHDNRRPSLRIATRSQNGAWRRRHTTPASGFKGVKAHRSRWVARISIGGVEHHLGCFATASEAAARYDAAARQAFGDFAMTNAGAA